MKICLLSYQGKSLLRRPGYLPHVPRAELVKLGHEVHVIVGPPYPPR